MSGRATRTGWVPNQHGAWAMLVTPFGFGLVLAVRAGTAGGWLVPLFACWILGYFAFHDASLWLKAAPARRGRYVPPLLTYAGASAVAGLVSLAWAGWALAWWALAYLPLLLPALWLASRRQERHLAGGLLTTGLAAAMLLVARFPDPLAMLADPALPAAALLAAMTFGYFIGTVLHVKALIRERNDPRSAPRCIAYHAVLAVLTVCAVVVGWLTWWWIPWALLLVVRAWWMPRARRKPGVIGAVEIVNSVLLLALVLFA